MSNDKVDKNGDATDTKPTRQCRYGSNCQYKNCRFQHPSPSPGGVSQPQTPLNTNKPCRYGSECRIQDKGCPFQHPAKSTTGTKQPSTKPQTTKTRAKKDGGLPLRSDFYCGPLEDAEAKGYRAAGILLLRCRPARADRFYQATASTTAKFNVISKNNHNHPRIQVLCCSEGKKGLNFLGGKIEPSDGQDSRITAAREFWEETGGIVPLEDCQQLVSLQSTGDNTNVETLPVWCGHGKYVLYVACDHDPVRQKQWNDLPWGHGKALISGVELPDGAEVDHLVWVDWELLKQSLQQPQNKGSPNKQQATISFWVPSSSTVTDTNNGKDTAEGVQVTVPVSRFAKPVFKDPKFQQGMQTVIDKMILVQRGEGDDTKQEKPTADGGLGISKWLQTLKIG